MSINDQNTNAEEPNGVLDAVIVGAGFAGMYMLHKLRERGFAARAFERGDGVGGTWYWNRYPGARCDVESMEYSYSFSDELQQEWAWSERYAGQPEILRYANHVADRFGLREHITFETSVVSAHFDEASGLWQVATDGGETLMARFCIMATGCLSTANMPHFDGLDAFAGRTFHTGNWPHEPVDFSGRRVAVIGTGSSAIQSIPVIAEQAAHLTVFQRTPNYSIPAHNRSLTSEEMDRIKAEYASFRAANRLQPGGFGSRLPRGDGSVRDDDERTRTERLEEAWNYGGFAFLSVYADSGIDAQANRIVAEFVRDKIRGLVSDPETAELLCPDQVIGCKRLCLDTHYFETYNRDNVDLVSIAKAPIERFDATGLITGGRHYAFDDVVFATGFDAMTGTLLRIDVRGRDGIALGEAWEAGPRTYLGLNVHGFPNLFTISGPGSPSVLTNMIVSIQQHVEWIADCMTDMREKGRTRIEAQADAQDAWVDHVNALADATLYPTCNSWYLGANVPGKPRVFMPHIGFPNYVEVCDDVVADDYRGFALS